MMASRSLFERLFEVVDCDGQHKVAEFAVPSDSGAEPTLDGKKAVSAIKRWPYNSLSNRALWA